MSNLPSRTPSAPSMCLRVGSLSDFRYLSAAFGVRIIYAGTKCVSGNPASRQRCQQLARARTAGQWPHRHRRALRRSTRARPCSRAAIVGGALLCHGGPGYFAHSTCRCGTAPAAVCRSRQQLSAGRPGSVQETWADHYVDCRNRCIETRFAAPLPPVSATRSCHGLCFTTAKEKLR